MENPTVSFIVPCYKLAHLLSECINSILAQTNRDFEVLIMDDCSPDNTAEISNSFADPRVKHVRNPRNLGHLRNYNEGIRRSRGEYVWLISADDYLRRPHVLERYVDLLKRNPRVGYVFCPGYGVRDGVETQELGRFSEQNDHDRIVPGDVLLKKLLGGNFVLTPSGLVRRQCYEKISMFLLDMPWCGDWYLWCLFALYYDVGYLAEPMLCYREQHDASMTDQLFRSKLDECAAEEIAVPWRIRRKAREAGNAAVAKECLVAVAATYARTMASERYRNANCFLNFEIFEESLRRHTRSSRQRNWIRARVLMGLGNEFYWQGDPALASEYYLAALEKDRLMVAVHVKRLLLTLGERGDRIRRAIRARR